MSRAVYDYTARGTDTEFTLRRNREAFDWVELTGGRAIDSAAVDTSLELFGERLATPIMLAPTARQRPLHPDGELGMYEAATAAQSAMIVSHASSFPFERIAQVAGCRAVVVTIDQTASAYERALHNRHLGGAPRNIERPSAEDLGNPYGVSPGRLWYEWSTCPTSGRWCRCRCSRRAS